MVSRLPLLPLVIAAWMFLVVSPQGQSGSQPTQNSGVTIAGSVVDGALSPVAGAVVTLSRDGREVGRATTDTSGAFRFTNIPAGSYQVRAEKMGFPVLTREVRVPSGVKTIQLPIVLSRPGDDMAKVDASAPGGRSAPMPTVPPPASGATGTVTVQGATAAGGRAGGGGQGQGRGVSSGSMANASPVFRAGERQEQIVSAQPYFGVIETPWSGYRYPHPTGEQYAHVPPNQFKATSAEPLSTFGADVDTASYSNVRRFLSNGQLPPRDAVRVEEFVNYFRFAYAEPRGVRPIGLTTEVGDCPWAPSHKLVLIGARAKPSVTREVEGRNIVLLIDVSGSMAPVERLPLIKTALGMFVDTLQADDRLAIVTYAGTSGVALPSTPVRQRDVIQRAIANLNAGGSTNGGSGMIMAYRVARESFIPGGVNRVILATDGDFNVGIVNQFDLLSLIQREKDSGVFLSVFGVGSGNLKDATMEMLADKGNGHYAYLDSLQEARRVLLREADATLETVAKDVKFQVEFNPAMVRAWKLIGYENRVMAAQDFNNDRKDGGEMGAGHTVTALYEIVPVNAPYPDEDRISGNGSVDPLRYGTQPQPAPGERGRRGGGAPVVDPAVASEWLTVKTRYKAPEGDRSDLMVDPVKSGARIEHLPLATAIAEFGLLLQTGSRDAELWSDLNRRLARIDVPGSLRPDVDGLRELVSIATSLARVR